MYPDNKQKGFPDTIRIKYVSLLIIIIFIYNGVLLMKKLLIYSLITFLAISYTALSFSGNGSGTESDPYQITTVEQLQEMNDDLSANYILMNDIDASDTENWNDWKGFYPIGRGTDGFTGRLDGQGFSIDSLVIRMPDELVVGLFGVIYDGANILNVNLKDANIEGKMSVGMFAGNINATEEESTILIEGCNCSGIVKGNFLYIGGFCGKNNSYYGESIIYNCSCEVEVYAGDRGDFVGGFCGYNYSLKGTSIIDDCFSIGNVTGYSENEYVGGFCGMNFAEDSSSTTLINDCYCISDVIGAAYVGGFCGSNEAESGNASITKSYNSGNTQGVGIVAGFCSSNVNTGWYATSTISKCSSTGTVTGEKYVSGFCTDNNSQAYLSSAVISDCNFIGEINGDESVAGFCAFNGSAFGEAKLLNCFCESEINGNKYVSGFTVTNSSGGNISDVSIENSYSKSNITGRDVSGFCYANSVAGIHSKIMIKNCFCECNISGAYSASGFIAENKAIQEESEAIITNCYSKCNIEGNKVYGFCRYNLSEYGRANINNCFSQCNVNYTQMYAGFCYLNITSYSSGFSEISNCYCANNTNGEQNDGGFLFSHEGDGKERTTYCYWDAELSGISISEGGYPKTTAEMMMQSSFSNWNFYNIWCIVEGETYPQLQHFVDCDTLVSVPDYGESSSILTIHPNPANDMITVSTLNDDLIINQIEIIDVTGSVVFKQSDISQYSLNIPVQDFPIGVYYVRTYINDQLHISPFIINR